MQDSKQKANMVLAGTTTGYLLAVPFQDSFLGGLIASAFGAAMVGGAADWFAVTALFRRPLGICFKTAVIPRNRARISRDIIDMLENRLLTRENIHSKIKGYDMTAILLNFLAQGGKEDLLESVPALIRDFTLRLKPQELGDFITALFTDNSERVPLALQLAKVLTWSDRQGYTEKVFDFMLAETEKLIGSQVMYKLLYEFIETVRKTYAGERTERKVADWLFNQGGFTPERLAEIARDKLQLFIKELYLPDNSLRLELLAYIRSLPEKLMDNVWQGKIENLKIKLFADKKLATGLARFIRQKAGQNSQGFFLSLLAGQLERGITYIAEDKAVYKKIDDYLTNALVVLVEKYHGKIALVAAKRLDEYTAEEISGLIEHKVSDDLQMIRLNGSTIGGVAGMLIFLLTCLFR